MDEQNNTQEKARGGFSKKKILLINGFAVVVAIICFVVVAVWLESKRPEKNKGVRHIFADIYVTLFSSFTFVY